MNTNTSTTQIELSAEFSFNNLRDLLDSELMLIGGGDVVQFGG